MTSRRNSRPSPFYAETNEESLAKLSEDFKELQANVASSLSTPFLIYLCLSQQQWVECAMRATIESICNFGSSKNSTTALDLPLFPGLRKHSKKPRWKDE